MDAFVVRIWRPGLGDAPAELRGTAVHLASGRDVTFTESETLIRFLAAGTSGETASAPAGTPIAGDQLRDSAAGNKEEGQE